MAANKLSIHNQYSNSTIPLKSRSKSSDSLSNYRRKFEIQKQEKQTQQKTSPMKKSQPTLANPENKPLETTCNATSILRRRFSLFRTKRSQHTHEKTNNNIQVLQQTIDKLRCDLQIKTDELENIKRSMESKRSSTIQPVTESIEQAMQLQTILNTRLEEMLNENELLKKSIQELESYAHQQASHSSTNNSLLTTSFTEPNNSVIKSTNFTSSVPTSRTEIRHKSEIEIEVKHDKQQINNANKTNPTPIASSSCPSVTRTNITNKQSLLPKSDENSLPTSLHSVPKRCILTNSIQTQTLPVLLTQSDRYSQQQKIKTLADEVITKNEKIQTLLREIADYQVTIKQQEQQLTNGKKDRDQLYFIVDERTNELRNLKQKNEQLEQMIRNEQEKSKDEKKLLSLLQESQSERDQLLSQKQQTYEHIQKLEEQTRTYESDVGKMREQVLCSKMKLDKKIDENQCLANKLTDMNKYCDRLEQENQKLKLQIEHEQKQIEECYALKSNIDIELQHKLEQMRKERHEYETKIMTLDDALKYAQKQYQTLQNNQHTIDNKHKQEIDEFKQHIHELELKIEEVIQDKALISIRCGELIEENRKLEKALADKEDDYEEKINIYKEKNTFLSTQIEDLEKKLAETKKQLELVTIEKDETLADMLIAVRVASEMRHDAEDRLNKVNDDLKRVTEHIEQERTLNKEVQRRQMHLPPTGRHSNGCCEVGHVRIKEMIRNLEANSRKNSVSTANHHLEPNARQRPLSQPCTRIETNAILSNHHRQFGTATDDAKILSSTKNNSSSFNNSPRSEASMRSITNEQYDEMKSIVESVFARMPGTVCKRDALLKWCVQRLANYGISITNFSNCWTDGIAFCSLLHSYLPDRIDLDTIKNESKKRRFEIAFEVASSVGIVSILDVDEMCSSEWPRWERVMYYVALIFRHFECSSSNPNISPILPIPQASSSPMSPTFSSSSSSPIICGSLRTSNSIPTMLCSPLQTV